MSEKLTPKTPAITAEDCHDLDGKPGWASRVRFAQPREIRAGAGLSIEARMQPHHQWQAIMLPGGGTRFVSAQQRDEVLEMIRTGNIPNRISP